MVFPVKLLAKVSSELTRDTLKSLIVILLVLPNLTYVRSVGSKYKAPNSSPELANLGKWYKILEGDPVCALKDNCEKLSNLTNVELVEIILGILVDIYYILVPASVEVVGTLTTGTLSNPNSDWAFAPSDGLKP